ncbi:MAG: tetratricopeptide repeat protein [Saprospiraceae bacterium]
MQDLPTFPNAFIGREYHLQALKSLLQKETTRLITLLGPGGMGKTRLSVRLGEMAADQFKHGVCFVGLEMVNNHQQVPLYIGQRLGLKESFGNSLLDEIIKELKDKHFLLILDNLEQILESRDLIERILNDCPGVCILTTSREILGLPQEIEYPLDSLNRPNPRLFPGTEDLLKFDAIELFVQKAQSCLPSFQLNQDNAAAIVAICQQLEGLPLPIELAAARVKLFSPEVILRKLETAGDLLKTRSIGVPLRHQTITNTVQWSYDLLDETEQQVFQQLALFRGGFTPTSLEAVCTGFEALEVIESFINKSLIVKGEEIHYIPRFRMLKLIRDYGLERLQGHPEKERYYHRFAQYFLSYIIEIQSTFQKKDPSKWVTLLEAEYENVRVALEWLISNSPELAAKMGVSIWPFYLNRGFLREGLEITEQLIALPIAEKALKAHLLEAAGTLLHNLGNYLKAKEYFKECLDLWKHLRDKIEIAKALNNLGWAEWRIGHYDHAISYSESALEIAEELQDKFAQTRALNNLAWTYMCQGKFKEAEDLQRNILQTHLATQNNRSIAFAKTNLGWALIRTGKGIEAERMINQGIQLFEALKDQQLMTYSWKIMALRRFWENDFGAALAILQEKCIPVFEKIGDIWGLASSHHQLGHVYFQLADLDQAKAHLAKSMELAQHSHDKFGEANSRLWLSKVFAAKDENSSTEDYLDQSLSLAATMDARELLMNGHLEKALRAQKQNAMEVAIIHTAIADFYAAALGPHQYQLFWSQIQTNIMVYQSVFKVDKAETAARLAHQWHGEEDHLSMPLKKEELQRRIHKLLNAEQTLSRNHDKTQVGQAAPSNEKEDPFTRKVRQIIEAHLQDPRFGLKELCQEVGVSHSHLHRKLSSLTGQSVSKFIRNIRLEKAKSLLLDSNLTITAVAYDTGFKDPDYFFRVFKQAFDLTPNEYRKVEQNK